MATPKRVKRNDEKNYADIYQENFIAQNDPAALGQAAFNRQLSSGIQRNRPGQERLAQDTNTAAVPASVENQSPYGREDYQYATGGTPVFGPQEPREPVGPSGQLYTGPVFQAGFGQPAGTGIPMPDLGSIAGIDAYARNRMGITGNEIQRRANEINRYNEMTRRRQAEFDANQARLRREAAAARAAQGEGGLTDPNLTPQLGDAANDPNINFLLAQDRAAQGETGLVDSGFRQGNVLGDAANDPNMDYLIARRRAAEARAAQGEGGSGSVGSSATMPDGMVVPGLEQASGIMPSTLLTPEEQRRQAAEARAAEGDYLAGNTMPSMEQMTGIMPSELGTPTDYRGAGLQDEAGRVREEAGILEREQDRTISATQSGYTQYDGQDTSPEPPFIGGGDDDDSPVTVTPRTQTEASSGISREEQNLYDTLDAETNAVLSNFNQKYNQFMQLAINRGAVRGNLEQQGFTGGIGQQVQDYLSTQEMQMLNQIITEKDRALQEIELRRNQVPDLALQNEAQRLQLAQANIGLKTQFAQDLAASVVSGMKSLDEAQRFADEHGLENIQDLIIKAAKAEIAAGADEASVRQSLVAAGISEDLLDSEDIDGLETDYTEVSNNFLLLADAALERADKNEASLDSFYDNTFGTAADGNFNILEAAGAGVTGLFLGVASLLGATPDYGVGVEDRAVVTGDLMSSSFFQAFGGDLQSEKGMTQNISFVRDAASQEQGLGYYNDTYRLTVDGNVYELKGADAVALVATLKQGNFTIPAQLKKLAEEVYNKGLGTGFQRFRSAFGTKEDYVDSLYETVMNKPAKKMSARDIRT